MKKIILVALALTLSVAPVFAQRTPKPAVSAYDALADAILALRQTEADFVATILDHHFDAAQRAYKAGDWERAAAQMAVFGSEGDNAVAGIRKRLVEGGHHHNAAGEEADVYDEGFVIVTKQAKRQVLEASKRMLDAEESSSREEAWAQFDKVAKELVYSKMKK